MLKQHNIFTTEDIDFLFGTNSMNLATLDRVFDLIEESFISEFGTIQKFLDISKSEQQDYLEHLISMGEAEKNTSIEFFSAMKLFANLLYALIIKDPVLAKEIDNHVNAGGNKANRLTISQIVAGL
jgi:hypothetical protein